jgi:mitogen-activated protein kinase 1/3
MNDNVELFASRYLKINQIGKGAYGSVIKYQDIVTKEMVAIKKLQKIDDIFDAKQVLREIIILKNCDHEHILKLKGFFIEENLGSLQVYVVTELMKFDLYTVIRNNQSEMTSDHIQYIMFQIFLGVFYLHENNIVHRDIKPNNILLDETCQVKLCDFGLAREVKDKTDGNKTEYVVTRYYRAPEIMLNSRKYDSAVDIWSIGCTFFELIESDILFKKAETYIELLNLIFKFLGTPNTEIIEQVENVHAKNWILKQEYYPPKRVSDHLKKTVSNEAKDLLDKCLVIDPNKRITAKEALHHPYFENIFEEGIDDKISQMKFDFSFEDSSKITLEQVVNRIRFEILSLQSLS